MPDLDLKGRSPGPGRGRGSGPHPRLDVQELEPLGQVEAQPLFSQPFFPLVRDDGDDAGRAAVPENARPPGQGPPVLGAAKGMVRGQGPIEEDGDLAFEIDAGQIVPAELGRGNAEADEDDLAGDPAGLEHAAGGGVGRKGEGVCPSGLHKAERRGARHDGRHFERDGLKERPVRHRGPQADPLSGQRDVSGGDVQLG